MAQGGCRLPALSHLITLMEASNNDRGVLRSGYCSCSVG